LSGLYATFHSRVLDADRLGVLSWLKVRHAAGIALSIQPVRP
jgi:hypothetical protein